MITAHLLRSTRHIVATIVTLGLVAMTAQAAPKAKFHIQELPSLPGGYQSPTPFALNNHGDIVGRASGSNGIGQAFIYRKGIIRQLPVGGGPNSGGEAIDINDSGHIVAQAVVSNYYRGYLIRGHTVIDLNEQTGLDVYPVGINDSGVIAANIPRGFSSEAITWSNGVVRYLGYLDPTNGSHAIDINRHGDVLGASIVSWFTPASGYFSVVFRNGNLSVLGSFYAEAFNDRGEVTGELETNLHPFIYRAGRIDPFGPLPGDHRAFPHAINNHGQIVGYSEGAGERYLAFLYSDGTLYDLNDLIPARSGWVLSSAHGINDRGQIIGHGVYLGQERSFLLTPLKKQGKPKKDPKPPKGFETPTGVFPGP